jgi:sugar phosphate isomerase/epimerase
MFKIAFSTVACPEWTLDEVSREAGRLGYDGVELRTFGTGPDQFACEPTLTDSGKIRGMFFEGGVEAMCLASSVSLDEPITPPVIGRVFGDPERPVRLVKSVIDVATAIRCPLVRIFGFELPRSERRSDGVARVRQRLNLALDACRNSGVKVVIENGGSFATARALLELTSGINNPHLGFAYSLAVASAAGENPVEGIELLGDRLWVAKVKDFDVSRQPCLPGDGIVPVAPAIRTLALRNYRGWVVFEWDRAWLRGLAPAEEVLPAAARRLYAMAQESGASQPAEFAAH